MNIDDSFKLEKDAIPYWREFYKFFFKIDNSCIKDVRDKFDNHDVEIYYKNKIYSIDEKTRNISFYNLFKKDKKILIETKGNIEKNKDGSSIFSTKADYWAYGWFKKNIIINPIIFKVKPIQNYITKTELEIKKSNTNELYHTENVLLEYETIKKHQINLSNKLSDWL